MEFKKVNFGVKFIFDLKDKVIVHPNKKALIIICFLKTVALEECIQFLSYQGLI